MKQGFIKVAAATPDIRVADVPFNTKQICSAIEEAQNNQAKIVVFPELCVTGYTCGDLFTQDVLLQAAKQALLEITEFTREKDMLVFVGVPLVVDAKLYNVAAALCRGEILGLTTKTFLPNYGEFYEMRQFTAGPDVPGEILFNGKKVPFGPGLLFQASSMEELIVSAEICEDVWSPIPPSIRAAMEGATVIVNCSASDETIGKDSYRRDLIKGQSARLIAGYIYANAGEGESTTDLVFGGHNLIAENGSILAESKRFENQIIYTELDIKRIVGERRKNTTFTMEKMCIRDRSGEAGIFCISKFELLENAKDYIQGNRIIFGSISIVLLMAGVTNYLNIVVTGILSRKKELGIMESVGMTKRQKRMLFMMEGGYYFCAVTVLLVTIGSVMLQWIKTYMETKLSYFVFQYPLIWLVVGLCCLAGISFAVPAGLYMLEKSHCEQ